jgi:hypothetical protein
MIRKRFSEENALDILRQIDFDLSSGSTVEMAIRAVDISGIDCLFGSSSGATWLCCGYRIMVEKLSSERKFIDFCQVGYS